MSRRPRRLEVFAVEPTAVQLSWGDLDPQEVEVRAGDHRTTVAHLGGPATVEVDGLEPERTVELAVAGDGWARTLRARTPAHPPGEELYRLATVSDTHLAVDHFGFFGTMKERPAPAEPHTVRCTRAALREAKAWGARHLVVKGDATNKGRHDEWATFGRVVAEAGLPCEVVPGNHEVRADREVDPDDALRALGLTPLGGARAVDVPGLRLVLIDTTRAGHNRGWIDHVEEEAVALVEAADRPVLLIGHHYPMVLPLPTFWPPGIPSHHVRSFLRRVHAAAPDTLYTAGHTHRHRRRRAAGVEVTEVGCPKDYPGTWAGYVVHEGGIRQVVRRVSDPGCLPWLEYTRWAALGTWGRFSPGRLTQRCFSLAWQGHRSPIPERTSGSAGHGTPGEDGSEVEPLP